MQGYTDIGQCETGRETAKAIEVNVETGTGADRWVWVPKSVMKTDENRSIYVKTWFARQNKLFTKQRAM